MKELETAINSLCTSETTSPPQTAPQVTWTSVPLTQIGYTQFRSVGTLSYAIPNIIPDDAKEVLVYVSTFVGNSGPSSLISHLKIFTEIEENDYVKYVGIRTYPQDAWISNSDNLWFPMPSNRRVHVQVPNAHTSYIDGYFYVIGYR